MAIVTHCPYCSVRLTLGDDQAGKPFECPECDKTLAVPVVSSTTPEPAAASSPLPSDESKDDFDSSEPRSREPRSPRRRRRRRYSPRDDDDYYDRRPRNASSAVLISVLLLGIILGGLAAGGLGLVGGFVMAQNRIVEDDGEGHRYDAYGRPVNQAASGMGFMCCATPVGSILGGIASMALLALFQRR
jgi:hypothetical protein